jgi:hypothetical protein
VEKRAAAHPPAGPEKIPKRGVRFPAGLAYRLPNDEPQWCGKHTHREVHMFRLLVRFLGSGAGRGRPARANVRRFTPRLEALEERANPSGGIASLGVEGFTGHAAVAADIGPSGAGGEFGHVAAPVRLTPRLASGAAGAGGEFGHVAAADIGPAAAVHPYGSKPGVSGGTGASLAAEVADAVWVGGAGGHVTPFGGQPGGVVVGSATGQVTPFGGHGEPGGANGHIELTLSRSSGEEIPQHTSGSIEPSISRSSGEEIPQ